MRPKLGRRRRDMSMNYESVINNAHLKCSVRYAMLRAEIVEKAKTRADKRKLLELVGHTLEGTLTPGKPYYWTFKDGSKARFQ